MTALAHGTTGPFRKEQCIHHGGDGGDSVDEC